MEQILKKYLLASNEFVWVKQRELRKNLTEIHLLKKKNSEISEYISMWQYERHLMSYKNHNLQN